jgi:hypothetical protein
MVLIVLVDVEPSPVMEDNAAFAAVTKCSMLPLFPLRPRSALLVECGGALEFSVFDESDCVRTVFARIKVIESSLENANQPSLYDPHRTVI